VRIHAPTRPENRHLETDGRGARSKTARSENARLRKGEENRLTRPELNLAIAGGARSDKVRTSSLGPDGNRFEDSVRFMAGFFSSVDGEVYWANRVGVACDFVYVSIVENGGQDARRNARPNDENATRELPAVMLGTVKGLAAKWRFANASTPDFHGYPGRGGFARPASFSACVRRAMSRNGGQGRPQ